MKGLETALNLLVAAYQSNTFDDFICDSADSVYAQQSMQEVKDRKLYLKQTLLEGIEAEDMSLKVMIEKLIRLEIAKQHLDD